MLQTKIGNNRMSCSCQEGSVKNIKLLTDIIHTSDNGPIAIGHLNESGDLKILTELTSSWL